MSDSLDRLKAALAQRYAIEREIGSGGMATVYLAQDVRHDRRVALKVLKPELAAVVGGERFLAEIQVTSHLQHPNILPLFDSGEADGFLYFVMPFVEGESLRDRLNREKQLPLGEAVRISTEVAEALQVAHEEGVIHRDIKPENILLSRGRPLVADFGIALAVSTAGAGRLTETGLSVGTPFYMSPEQAAGDRSTDARSDIYSLGCVLYEMLVGEPPFTGSSAQAVLTKILTGTPTPARVARSTVPLNVDAAIRRALSRLPADRFSSAHDLGRALADVSFRFGEEPEAAAPAPRDRRRRLVTRALAVSAPVLGILTAWSLLRADTTASPVATARYQVLLPDSAPLTFTGPAPLGAWQSSLALSRDGSTLAFVAPEEGSTALWVRDIRSGATRRLESTDRAYSPFFSPDGAWIAFFVDATLRKIQIEGGRSLPLADGLGIPVGGVWLPDGRIFVSAGEGLRPKFIGDGGGVVDSLPRSPAFLRFYHPSPLPESDWLVGTGYSGQLSILSLRDGRILGITRSGVRPLDSIPPADMLVGFQPIYAPSGHLLYLSNGDGELMALPFDGRKLAVLGPPVPVVSGVRREETNGFGHYALGPLGELIYAPGRNAHRGHLAFIDASGATDTLDFPRDHYDLLRLSPDGRRLLTAIRAESGHPYSSEILDLETGRRTKIAGPPELVNRGVAWLPDGSGILITRSDPVTWEQKVTVVHTLADGSERPVGEGQLFWPIVHPSGKLITGGDLYCSPRILDLAGGEKKGEWGDGCQYSFSPDGKWLAYNPNERDGASVVPFPGSRRYTACAPATEQPFWHPDGSYLYCKGVREYWRLAFSPTGGADGGPRFGRPELFARGPFVRVWSSSHALAPDGRLLVVLGPDEQSTDHLEVITGFVAQLPGLAPAARK